MTKRKPRKVAKPRKVQERADGVSPIHGAPPEESGRESAGESGSDDAGAHGQFPIVGIGASAGGLEAFTQLLAALPLDTGMGFVLVQHLDPQHDSALAQILSRATSLPVAEISDNQRVEPNHIYVIPRDTNLSIERGALKLSARATSRTPPRPIDAFFESLAQDRRELAIGIVLSGTASDGTLGLEAIKAEAGITFAQDQTAKYDSMPRSAIASGSVDLVLSPADIALELARIAAHPAVAGQLLELREKTEGGRTNVDRGEIDHAKSAAHPYHDTAPASGSPPDVSNGSSRSAEKQVHARPKREQRSEGTPGDAYKKILVMLRNHSAVDFSLYKSTTIRRRIARRLVLSKQPTLGEYAHFLQGNIPELDALYSDVLIGVTSFFRNPEVFESIQREVLPALLKQRNDETIRCWVPGCSTGQEAYSLAMLFVEVAEKAQSARPLQMFATDLSEAQLDKARHGLYARSLAEDVSPQRLRRFFTEEEGGYRVGKALREMVVFSRQNVIADPPFSRMDLISCRNLLIYLEPEVQKKAIAMFHYALRPGGFLVLGASESIGGFTELFATVDKKHKIYARKAAPTPVVQMPLSRFARDHVHPSDERQWPPRKAVGAFSSERANGPSGERSPEREADRVAVNQFAPPSVLINAESQVLQFRGTTSAYLEPPTGKASFHILKMARDGLTVPLRSAIAEATKENKTARRENVRLQRNREAGEPRTVNLEVIPLKNLAERYFLIVFEEPDRAGRGPARQPPARSTLSKAEEATRVAELETELSETREYLQAIQEQHEAAIEELQASNEEVQSGNEELQSVNEELETSKEELESANEELSTVNDEMRNRNTELNRLNNDLINLQNSTKLAIVLLGRDLSVRRFSTQAERLFGLLAADVGRPIGNVRHTLVRPFQAASAHAGLPNAAQTPDAHVDLERIAAEVIETLREQECEVQDKTGRWYQLRVQPYVTVDGNVDGGVLVLIDVDTMKRAEQAIAGARDYAEAVIATVREPLLVLDDQMRIESANLAFYRTFAVNPKGTVGRFLHEIGIGQWDIPPLYERLEKVLSESDAFEDFQVQHDFPGVGPKIILLNARRMRGAEGKSARILLAIEDITARRRAEATTTRLAAIVASSSDAIISKDLRGVITSWNKGAEHLFGYSAEEVTGQSGRLLIPEDRSDEEQRILERIRHGDTVEHFETVRRHKDGTPVEVSLTMSVLKDASEHDVGVSEIARDISERKRYEEALRQSEARYRELFDSMDEGYCIIEMIFAPGSQNPVDYRFLEVNRAFEKQSGMHDVVGKRMLELVPSIEGYWLSNFGRTALTGESIRFDNEYKALNRWFDVYAFKVGEPDGRKVAVLFTDITGQRKLKQELSQKAEQLAAESRGKDEFLAMLSHELRNPIAAIRSAVYLLGLEANSNQDAVERESLEVIERQTANLVKLISDLLEVSRVVSGRVRLDEKTVDITEIVRHAIETVAPLIAEHKHELVQHLCSDQVLISADATRLEEVFINLLNNAAKYTPNGGRIEVGCEKLESRNAVRILVRDNGVGIETDLLKEGHLFDLFTQADRSLDRSGGGLGIGLSLAHRLVDMHRGTIEAKSPPEEGKRGSEFIVTLPLGPDTAEADVPIQAVPVAEEGKRVLVVDDNVDQAAMLSGTLRHKGYSVQVAYTGPDGLRVAERWRPEIVLLDIGLPGMDGYEVARRLRADPSMTGSAMRLIAITGYGRTNDIALARDAGFDGHLTKPVVFADLEKMMATPEVKSVGREHRP
jgi:two-component system CheB/CheR fusion protein